jgi:para-nitrobenzyl esterase
MTRQKTCLRIAISLVLGTSIALAAEPSPNRCPATGPDIACTEQGAVRGVVEGDLFAFKGMPYAQPPVGDLRWRPSASPFAWEGLRDGSQFGAICPQIIAKKVTGEEDCLTLNIWRPQQLPQQPLPVMVWLTGGGNRGLSGQGTAGYGGVRYNGGALVPEGVVFVSFNVRLGALGFLAHPSLDAERPEKVSGNYGNLDQIAMLRWLRRNIAAFGGDPQRIMLFGTSAGGGNTCALISSPHARGLFHAAAMQSSVPTGCEIPTLADVQNGTGQRVVMAAGCDAAPDIAACLRRKTVAEIVSAVPSGTDVFPRIYGPNMDGHVFPDQPLKIISRRAHTSMPIIIGDTMDETLGWVRSGTPITDAETYATEIGKVFGTAARDRIITAYPLSAYPSPLKAFVQLTTDAQFTCTSRRVARAFSSAQKEPVYRYVFSHVMENDPQLKAQAANHTIEHAFLFPFQGKYKPTDADLAVQRFMVGYWTRLARAGNPNGAGDPQWPVAVGDAYLEIGTAPSAKRGPDAAKCDFWDTVKMQWPHL